MMPTRPGRGSLPGCRHRHNAGIQVSSRLRGRGFRLGIARWGDVRAGLPLGRREQPINLKGLVAGSGEGAVDLGGDLPIG